MKAKDVKRGDKWFLHHQRNFPVFPEFAEGTNNINMSDLR